MSDATQVIESTVDKMLERIDALTGKLGIAATELWGYTVKAMIVNAKRDMTEALALLFIPALLIGWAVHVNRMTLPREQKHEQELVQHNPPDLQGWYICHSNVTDDGLSFAGWLYVASAVGCVIIGLACIGAGVSTVISAQARLHTAEYDAYKSLLADLLPKQDDE